MATILVVEDQRDIAESIGDFLALHGFMVDFAADGLTASNLASQQTYDLYIFDIGLPGMDGLSLCQLLRKNPVNTTPVLFLTARDRLEDKLAGFDAGGDDYLVKPFQLAELLARVKALIKRCNNQQQAIIQIEDLIINTRQCEVTRQGQTITLSPMGYQLLLVLAQASPNVVSRQRLESEIWQDTAPDSDALRSHLYSLRQKIDKPFAVPLLHTLAKRGFKLCK
ncbi:response regulator transcription factor [Algibacillus agarilyticus]|uniref:response regulator transcription factor n=1 Tax=Algibacillus agarilyticus TaxID=2234133 RepID=UPI001E61D9EE|nr:response regulator transcription factor [Algibacillus agarilyticus]